MDRSDDEPDPAPPRPSGGGCGCSALTWPPTTSRGTPIDYEFLYFRGDAFQYRLRAERRKAQPPDVPDTPATPAAATPAPKRAGAARTRKPASKGNPNA
jgi:hypothetical protein